MSYEMPSMPPAPPVAPPAPPAGGPGVPPAPPAPPAGGPSVPPVPPAVESISAIPAFPPVQLLASPSGLVWILGNDYTRGWNGVMWVPLG